MNFIYKTPGYILCLLAGFCLSFGGPIIRSFETSNPWQILFWRSVFFILALIVFLILTYKKEAFNIVKRSGLPGVFGGLFLSFSFVGYIFAMTETTIANVVFIISTQTLFLAVFGYFFLKEKISLRSSFAIFLAMSFYLLNALKKRSSKLYLIFHLLGKKQMKMKKKFLEKIVIKNQKKYFYQYFSNNY